LPATGEGEPWGQRGAEGKKEGNCNFSDKIGRGEGQRKADNGSERRSVKMLGAQKTAERGIWVVPMGGKKIA